MHKISRWELKEVSVSPIYPPAAVTKPPLTLAIAQDSEQILALLQNLKFQSSFQYSHKLSIHHREGKRMACKHLLHHQNLPRHFLRDKPQHTYMLTTTVKLN